MPQELLLHALRIFVMISSSRSIKSRLTFHKNLFPFTKGFHLDITIIFWAILRHPILANLVTYLVYVCVATKIIFQIWIKFQIYMNKLIVYKQKCIRLLEYLSKSWQASATWCLINRLITWLASLEFSRSIRCSQSTPVYKWLEFEIYFILYILISWVCIHLSFVLVFKELYIYIWKYLMPYLLPFVYMLQMCSEKYCYLGL